MKQKFTPRVYFLNESIGSGVSNGPTKTLEMPSQDQLQGILRQHMQAQEQQREKSLNEAGEKAVSTLTTILNGGGAVEKFLMDKNVYKAIADGWMTDEVTPELVQQFKERILLPIYQRQGWNINVAQINQIGINFDTNRLFNGLPSMKVLMKGTNSAMMIPVSSNNTGTTTYMPLPSTLGFATIPPSLQSVIPTTIQQMQKPSDSGPNLSFFKLPEKQNSGGDGITGFINTFRDAIANSGRESIQMKNILDNIHTISQLWNTQQLNQEQRDLFKKALTLGEKVGGNGYLRIDDLRPLGDGFVMTITKTVLSRAESTEIDRLNKQLDDARKHSNRNAIFQAASLIDQINLIKNSIGRKLVDVFVNQQNWRQVL